MTEIEVNKINQRIGEKIKKRRKQLGLTLQEVGEAINVSTSQVLKYEKGQQRIDCMQIIKIADFLAVPLTYFFEDESFLANQVPDTPLSRLAIYFKKVKNVSMQQAIITLCQNVSEIDALTVD